MNVEEALRRIEDLVAVVQEFVDNAATTDQAGVTVDLSDLSCADDAGVRALEELREREPVLRVARGRISRFSCSSTTPMGVTRRNRSRL